MKAIFSVGAFSSLQGSPGPRVASASCDWSGYGELGAQVVADALDDEDAEQGAEPVLQGPREAVRAGHVVEHGEPNAHSTDGRLRGHLEGARLAAAARLNPAWHNRAGSTCCGWDRHGGSADPPHAR